MVHVEYKVVSTEHLISDRQLETDFGIEGWVLQTILYWDGYLFYHFIRPKLEI